VELISFHENTEEPKFAVFESMEMEETDNSLVFHCGPAYQQFAMTRETNSPSQDIDDIQEIEIAEGEEKDSDVPPGNKLHFHILISIFFVHSIF